MQSGTIVEDAVKKISQVSFRFLSLRLTRLLLNIMSLRHLHNIVKNAI